MAEANKTIPFKMRPPLFLPKIPTITPMMVRRITNQFNHPKKGIRPIIIMINEMIPRILLAVFIFKYYLLQINVSHRTKHVALQNMFVLSERHRLALQRITFANKKKYYG